MFPQRGLKYKPKFKKQIPVWSILGSFLAICGGLGFKYHNFVGTQIGSPTMKPASC